MVTQRTYSYKDVDMLLACQTVAENFKAHQSEIVALRSAWADPFIADYQTRLNNAIQTYLGLDPRKDLKVATQTVVQLQEGAIKELSFLKVQLEADFTADKARLQTLLNALGFQSYWKAVQRKDQQSLIQLLYQYRNGLTDGIKKELLAKGIQKELVNRISGYADSLRNANVSQETLKGSSKEITEAGTVAFNVLYEQAIAICKICARLFADNPQVKDKFVFSGLVKKMGATKRETVAQPSNTPAQPSVVPVA